MKSESVSTAANVAAKDARSKMMRFVENWIKEGREVDLVEISADDRGGAMTAIVDGALVWVEVHGE